KFAQTIALEGIKTIREARKEVKRCVNTLRIASEEARQLTGETVPFDQMPGSEKKMGYYTREPVGVIAAITPFNDHLNLIDFKVIKVISEARKEVKRCVNTLSIVSEEARQLTGETVPFDQMPGSEKKMGYYTREPVGVIAAITPFNDPLNLIAHKVAPAIAGGNAVILKPHNETPFSALMLAEVFVRVGLPKNVLQVLSGRGRVVGQKLITDERVQMISFTGGRSTGEDMIKMAGLKKASMELGSNAPTIIMEDADLELALPSVVSGAFAGAGQNCLHVQRLLVHESVYDTVSERFIS